MVVGRGVGGVGVLLAITTEVRHKNCMIRAALVHARNHVWGDCVDPSDLKLCPSPSQISRNYPVYKNDLYLHPDALLRKLSQL